MHHRSHADSEDVEDAINDPQTSVCMFDIRDKDAYHEKHVRHAVNLPASLFLDKTPTELVMILRDHYIHCFIQNMINVYPHKQSSISIHRQEITFIIINHDEDTPELNRNAEFLRNSLQKISEKSKLIKELIYFEGDTRKDLPKLKILIYRRRIEEVEEHHQGFINRAIAVKIEENSQNQDQDIQIDQSTIDDEEESKMATKQPQWGPQNEDIQEIIPLRVFHGNIDVYLDYAITCSKLSEKEILQMLWDRKKSARPWEPVMTIFSIGKTKPVVPLDILMRASISESFGRRIEYTETEIAKKKWKKFRRHFRMSGRSKITKTEIIDENITQTEYLFSNGFRFTWNVAVCPSSDRSGDFLRSVATSMEFCSCGESMFLLAGGEYSFWALVYYFLISKKWSILRSLSYLQFKFGESGFPVFTGKDFLVNIITLLEEERKLLPYLWPSVPYASFLTFFLGHEPNFPENMNAFLTKHPYEPKRMILFEAISEGNCAKVKELLEKNPDLAVCRNTFGELDQTPLLACLEATLKDPTNPILQDSVCLDLLCAKGAIHITSLLGRDVLFYAVALGDSCVKEFRDRGCYTHYTTASMRMNPLQRAIKFQLGTEAILSLMNEYTVNHRDIFHRTPAQYVVSEYNREIEEKKHLLECLANGGADLHVHDIEGRNILSVAENQKELLSFLLKLMKMEENIRYPPYKSFAKERSNIHVEYFVDGENTFLAILDTLRSSQTSIYLADWWMTPKIHLDRRNKDPKEWEASRLDNVLKTMAEKGVIIRILLWDNFEPVERIGSVRVEAYLEALHDNIHVMRHASTVTQGFSHHQKIVVVDDCVAFVGGLDLCSNRWDTNNHDIAPSTLYPGKDYYNPRYKTAMDDMYDHEKDYNLLAKGNRSAPRMGWHDLSFRVDGLAAHDVSINFVQRWNFIAKLHSSAIPLRHPVKNELVRIHTERSFSCTAQIVRSVGDWSIGHKVREQSVFNAIKMAITQAESFVYIETQFFISLQKEKNYTEDPMSLSDVIVNRIRMAIQQEKPFQFIIVLPAFPEGDPVHDEMILRIMYWQLKTIHYIENKITESAYGLLCGPSDYIRFYSLAKSGLVSGIPRVEQIYIHAKLLITDSTAICGSANLNMRSLMGDRDSEIAVVVHNKDFCESLRKVLWEEHVGSMGSEWSGDCVKDAALWYSVAKNNSKLYKNFFSNSCPWGEPQNIAQFQQAENQMASHWASERVNNELHYNKLKARIKGHLVLYPRQFLREDVQETNAYKIGLKDLFNPLNGISLITNAKEIAVFNMMEFLLQ